ncbi:hypothetical protein D9758_008443 [Tetrapyrgos nigripes]|uniref:shikimate kinase n=1 Tax=Tetrapyrgos nigripes TaxID=182062 RepID=A0A8H5FQS4_9AGAR|nr:hypothetical protein D9758_008443 [Tetrapyrgos nigripes]
MSQNVLDRNGSIVLIGMRGVGKTTLGTIASKALNWPFYDSDLIFEERQKVSVAHFIHTHGWDLFRRIESDILYDILPSNPKGKVIACGGGIIELERNRTLLKKFRDEYGYVIHVLREKEPVLAYLQSSPAYPPFLHETAIEAWDRRATFFRECCSYEFVSLTVPIPQGREGIITPDQTLALKPVETDFFRLLRFIHGVDTNKVLGLGGPRRSYILSLTFDDIRKAIPLLEDLSLGIDVWELRVDLLAEWDLTFISFQVATLRHHSTLPILFTLRTRGHGGRYPDVTPELSDSASIERHAQLLQHALHLGIEYVDIQFGAPESTMRSLLQHKRNSSILTSYTDWSGKLNWNHPQTRVLYESMRGWNPDLMMIVGVAKTFEDNMALRQFVGDRRIHPPLIAVNMGPEGKISRVLNPTLSPLSHPLLPRPAAPGQVSFYEAQTILYLTGLLPPKTFYLLGTPKLRNTSSIPTITITTTTMSAPTIHAINTAFQTLGLPYTYQKFELEKAHENGQLDLEDVGRRLREQMYGGGPHVGEDGVGTGGGSNTHTFGGASSSVPLPLQEGITKHLGLGHVTRHARIIGAVDIITVVPYTPLPSATSATIPTVVAGYCTSNSNGHGHPQTDPASSFGGPTNTTTTVTTLSGDNTAWRAIKSCLLRSLTPSNIITKETTALVLVSGRGGIKGTMATSGSGSIASARGAVYALYLIGVVRIWIWVCNNDVKSGEDVSRGFEGVDGGLLKVRVVQDLGEILRETKQGERDRWALPTMIISAIPSSSFSDHSSGNGLGLQLEHFSDAGGVAIDLDLASPSSGHSDLLKLAKEKRDRGVLWAGVEGIEVLLEQVYEQCRIWTGRRAPKNKVRKRMMTEYEEVWRSWRSLREG